MYLPLREQKTYKECWLCSVHSLCWLHGLQPFPICAESTWYRPAVNLHRPSKDWRRTMHPACLCFHSLKLPLTETSTPLCHLKRPERGLRQTALLLDHNCLKRVLLYLISLWPSHATTNTTTKQKITALNMPPPPPIPERMIYLPYHFSAKNCFL